MAKYGQDWYDRQKELCRRRAKIRYHEHPELRPSPEQTRASARKWRARNVEKVRTRKREYARNKFGHKPLPLPDKDGMVPCRKCGTPRKHGGPKCVRCRRKTEAAYRDRNRDLVNKRLSDYKKNNPELCAENDSVHRSRRRATLRNCVGTHTVAEWRAILKKHNNKCAQCGHKKGLAKDHIIPLSKGGTNFAFNLQPLCKPCNSVKHAKVEPGAQHSLFDRSNHPSLASL